MPPNRATLPVSIVVPYFDEAGEMEDLLLALTAQESHPKEVIIVGVGPEDLALNKFSDWSSAIPFSLKFVPAPCAYPGRARNIGVAESSCPWIAFLDCGLIPQPTWLSTLFAVAKDNGSGAWASCVFHGKSAIATMMAAYSYGQDSIVHNIVGASLFHRQVFSTVEPFCEYLRAGEDTLWRKKYFKKFAPQKEPVEGAMVAYGDFPGSILSAAKKYYTYARHVAMGNVSIFSTLFYLAYFLFFIYAVIESPLVAFFLLAVQGVISGIFRPIFKSAAFPWWGRYHYLPLIGIPVAIILDMSKGIGLISGFIWGVKRGITRKRMSLKEGEKIRIARITTTPFAFTNIKKFLTEIARKRDCDVKLISSGEKYLSITPESFGLPHINVNIKREISLFRDIISVIVLSIIFRRGKFHIIHSHAPKAGLVTALAGFLAGVPVRLHTFTGQRWETLRGLRRYFMILCDRIIGRLNTWNYADGPAQLNYLREQKIVPVNRSSCLGSGSFGGIDPDGVPAAQTISAMKRKVRGELGISEQTFVVLFVGRLVMDKGVKELAACAHCWNKEGKDIALVLVGSMEEGSNSLSGPLQREMTNNPRVFMPGFKSDVVSWMAAADVLALPSYREGFSAVILHAALLGLPAVGSNIRGISDVIDDGQTGLLCKVRSAEDLKRKIESFFSDRKLLADCGERAKKRVGASFSYRRLVQDQLRDYKNFTARL